MRTVRRGFESTDVASIVSDARGAVFVEKLIAYLPLLFAFFAAWELAELAAAKLVVQRASAAAGRAAAVVLADDPVFYDDEAVGSYGGLRQEDIELAAGMILSSIPRLTSDFEVSVSETPEGVGPIEVTVDAEYTCGLGTLYCAGAGSIYLSATTTHTYQGAKYAYAAPGGLGSAGGALLARSGYRAGNNNQSGGQPMQPKPNLPGDPPLRPHSDCNCPGMWEVDTDKLRQEVEARAADFCAKGITVAWSGGPVVMEAAEKWSTQNGGQSLEATAGGKWLNEMQLPKQALESIKDKNGNELKDKNGKRIRKKCRPIREVPSRHLWDLASELLMNCAVKNKDKTNSTVVRFQNCAAVAEAKKNGKKDGGALGWITWERIERPILQKGGMTIECRDYQSGQVEPCCEKTDPNDPIVSPPGTPPQSPITENPPTLP